MSDTYTAAVAAETANNSENQQETQVNQEDVPIENNSVQAKKIRALKLKVDGEEFEEQLPFEIDESNKEQVEFLKRHLQMSKAASKRMNEAALTRKQAEQFIQALQNDPMKVLSNPKVMGEEKFRAIAESYLAKQLQDQLLSPEERKRIEMEEKLRGYEEQEKTQRETAEQEQIQQLEQHYAQQYQKTIIDALQTSNLPKNPFTVRRMAELMQKNLQHGLDLEPQYLAQLVREDYQKELVSLIGSSDADQIIAMFGDDVANKIRKADLAKFKSAKPTFNNQQTATPKSESNKRMRADEFEAYLKRKNK